jgi:hypothetical protein
MKWTVIAAVVLLAGIASASADGATVQERYRDLIRPHGHPRSDAVHQADLDYCYNQTGDIRAFADTPAFKECMLGRGDRWQSTRVTGAPSTVGCQVNSTPDAPPFACNSRTREIEMRQWPCKRCDGRERCRGRYAQWPTAPATWAASDSASM